MSKLININILAIYVLYYQHADIVSGEALSAEVLMVAKSGAVCVPDVVLRNLRQHLSNATERLFCHVINGLYAIAPLT